MTKKRLALRIGIATAVVILIAVAFMTFANNHVLSQSEARIFEQSEDLAHAQTALILGSRVYANGEMSDVFADRVIKGLELYQEGIVDKILVSGDHGRTDYDEVNTAKEYLLENGVPEEDLFLDHAGFDTYDSMYRAKHIFEVDSAIVVTQDFHLPRAIYIGNAIGLEANGYIADRQPYLSARWNNLRESLARVKAVLEVTINAQPKFLGDPIPITGNGTLSWD